MLCENCGVEMEPMTHSRESCLENQIDNLDSQLTDVCDLRTRLEALEKWGREIITFLDGFIFYDSDMGDFNALFDQARTLGLVEE